ncbi:MAG: gluconate 2-dehydrogenase subunit 3 family protein [Acidobacteria bacterium]|nr:gluconate 2-dehydrogenase subunit 3 family protein [Acidobacteriota bacterium]
MDSRRDTLKIIGAIGTTCAFPFSADELYGQHEHPPAPAGAKPPPAPRFFGRAEFETISQMAETIIPATGTPGAIAAGVPAYIDSVVFADRGQQKLCRQGLRSLDARAGKQFGRPFRRLAEPERIELLERMTAEPFFQLIKNLTADGYYTSRAGMVEELGFQGGSVLAGFPGCNHPEPRS